MYIDEGNHMLAQPEYIFKSSSVKLNNSVKFNFIKISSTEKFALYVWLFQVVLSIVITVT